MHGFTDLSITAHPKSIRGYSLKNPSFDERKWAPSVARTQETQVALLVRLKIFQTIGRFLPAADLAFLSPYATSKLKRFGDSPTDLKPEAMPTCTTLPL